LTSAPGSIPVNLFFKTVEKFSSEATYPSVETAPISEGVKTISVESAFEFIVLVAGTRVLKSIVCPNFPHFSTSELSLKKIYPTVRSST